MNTLLTGIWSGEIKPTDPQSATHLGLLGTISLPDDTIFLDCPADRRAQYFEAAEILEPGLTVADVLAEEFNIFAEDRTIVVLCPRRAYLRPKAQDFDRAKTSSLQTILQRMAACTGTVSEDSPDVHQL